MKRFLHMPFAVTAVSFDRNGRTIPTRIDCAGRSFQLQPAAQEGLYGFSRAGRYYWIEKHGSSWRWIDSTRQLEGFLV